MSMCVDCVYACVAVRKLTKKHSMKNVKLLIDTFTKAFDDINKPFKGHTNFEIDFATARKRFPVVILGGIARKRFPVVILGGIQVRQGTGLRKHFRLAHALPMAEKKQHHL